ncbi:MAG: serine/threonine-protein kinase [Labilithrix sp.]
MGPAGQTRADHLARVGSRLGDWVLEKLLGWGATSAVYEAVRPEDGAHRAIKLLNRALCSEPPVVERFLHEAYLAGAIRHRGIVHVHGDGMSDGSVYLVLDLLDGETLEERRLHMGKLPLDAVLTIAEELLSVLRAVHAAGIVHRDLKPQNVFATNHGELKLLDFGTARVFDPLPGVKRQPKSIDGLVVGSPSFMSPEAARGERSKIDARSDLWSLGATLFTLLTGEYVHIAKDPHKRLLAAAMKPARSLGEAAPWAPPEVVAVIDRALAFDPSARWPDAVTMRRALRSALAISEPPPSEAAIV